jgi:hypothetical protein
MRSAQQILDDTFLEMRWRCLSLAADLDRLERATGGNWLKSDPRLASLHEAIRALLSGGTDHAERVQLIFSDKSPGPK